MSDTPARVYAAYASKDEIDHNIGGIHLEEFFRDLEFHLEEVEEAFQVVQDVPTESTVASATSPEEISVQMKFEDHALFVKDMKTPVVKTKPPKPTRPAPPPPAQAPTRTASATVSVAPKVYLHTPPRHSSDVPVDIDPLEEYLNAQNLDPKNPAPFMKDIGMPAVVKKHPQLKRPVPPPPPPPTLARRETAPASGSRPMNNGASKDDKEQKSDVSSAKQSLLTPHRPVQGGPLVQIDPIINNPAPTRSIPSTIAPGSVPKDQSAKAQATSSSDAAIAPKPPKRSLFSRSKK